MAAPSTVGHAAQQSEYPIKIRMVDVEVQPEDQAEVLAIADH